MPAPWKLVQSFIREATEDAAYQPVASIDVAYAKLRAIQRGHFSVATCPSACGTMQLSSTIGSTSFTFGVPQGLGQGDIIAAAEAALQLIEGKTVAQARALLRRVKRRRADFSSYQP